MSKPTTKPRCSCGAYIAPCKRCGAIPTAPEAESLFDYRPTPQRMARIDRRVRLLKMRDLTDEFILDCVAGVVV